MTQEEHYAYSKVMEDDGLIALQTMIADGHSEEDIREFYDEIGFHPNQATIDYLHEHVAA
ncbi:hypothetical protein F6X56_15015 [Rhodococcus erythropolis]|uniref:hypothetical protein n=1 Tax=Rhodococcus erythropolis TaxID=1833 RepID=UPI001246134B|nr:hypothetical protein [Rhodococcus erythropolis]QEX10932.1 hypothetical protein F6X56_15015 [Rhodococcus erythropolis]